MEREIANAITPLNRHWYGFVYCNMRLNNLVSNAFAFIFFLELFPAIRCNLLVFLRKKQEGFSLLSGLFRYVIVINFG